MSNDGKIDHIAELQKKLYTRDTDSLPERRIGVLRPIKNNIKSAWGSLKPKFPERRFKEATPGYKKFFNFSIIFLILCLVFLGYSFYKGSNTLSSKNVGLDILGNSFVSGGDELPIQIEVSNKNSVALNSVILTVEYPKGSVDVSGGEVIRTDKDLGNIESGKTKSESFTAVLYGEQGSIRTIKAKLEYKLPNSNISFVKESTFSVVISSSPVELFIDGQETVPSNQPVNLSVRTALVADKALDDMVVKVDYPVGFKFQSASPAPSWGNNIWSVSDLERGESRTINITGIVIGQNGDEKAFRAYVGSQDKELPSKLAVTYGSMLHSILLEESFLEAKIIIGEREGGVVALDKNSPVTGIIQWKNNLNTQLTDPEIELFIEGGMFDEDSVFASQGFYDSTRRTIVWNKETVLNFNSLEPGETGSFGFTFKPVVFEETKPDDIDLFLSVKGRSSDAGFEDRVVTNIDKVTARFVGTIKFSGEGSYGSGPIKNTGSIPPKVDQTTTYTVSWSVLPGESAVSQAQAKAKLPFYVGWGGVVVPKTESIRFDANSRTVIWDIGKINQSVGSTKPRTVSFQVSIKPSSSQVGSALTLLEETGVAGVDSATGALIKITRPAITTFMKKDPTFKKGDEIVVR